jgi:hypothetical protein
MNSRRVASFAVYYRDNSKVFVSKLFVLRSGLRPNRISPAPLPEIRIALVVWIVCLDRPNAARGGRETAFRRHFRPKRGPFCAFPERLPDPVNTNLKANAVLRNYLESAKRPIIKHAAIQQEIIWTTYRDMKWII